MADDPSGPNQPGGPGPGPPAGEPKIHVDSDWKREAQAEKERLAREAETAAAAPLRPPAAEGEEAEAEAEPEGPLPPATFDALVQQLASQAVLFLSRQRDPETGESLQRLDLAKHTIDLLGVIEEKTKGNLTADEQRLLDTVLYELRMAYVGAAS
jgi:hypothetical protein